MKADRRYGAMDARPAMGNPMESKASWAHRAVMRSGIEARPTIAETVS